MKRALILSYLIIMALRVQASDFTSVGIYSATIEACRHYSAAEIEAIALITGHNSTSYFKSQTFSDLLASCRNQSFKNSIRDLTFFKPALFTSTLLNSPDFNRALEECYHNEPRAREFFANSVVLADNKGKVLGLLATVGIFKGTGILLKGTSLVLLRLSKYAHQSLQVAEGSFAALMGASLLTSDSPEKKVRPEISYDEFVKAIDVGDKTAANTNYAAEINGVIDKNKKM